MAKGDKQDVAKAKSAATKKKVNKTSVSQTPKQLKDARVKTNQVKPNTFGKVYYSTSKNGTQVKASYVSKSDTWGSGKTERTTVKGKPYTGTEKSTSAKISADNKNRVKNAKNKMKAQGAKINSSATSNYNRRSK
jgi:hypothetical protein